MVKQSAPPLPSASSATAVAAQPPLPTQVGQQLQALEAKFEELKAQVRQAQQLATLGTAATTIAHEMNNLLTPVLSYAMAAQSSDDEAFRTKALQTTVKHVQMLVRMADRILSIAAANSSEPELVPVRTVIEEAVESLCREPARDGITLTIEADETLTLFADRLQLRQVLFNLLLNAREVLAETHGGALKIRSARDGEEVLIELTNAGKPIPADLLPHIFDPLQSSRPAGQDGSQRCRGLGLTLCRDLIEENHGTISVKSSAATGTTFTLRLPSEPPADR